MNVQTIGLVLLLALSNTGCASLWGEKVKPIEVVTKPAERLPLNIENPQLEPLAVPEWYVVTPDNSEQIWNQMTDKGENAVLFGITDNGYKDLAAIMSKLRGHIQTQREIIGKYKDYYEPEKKKD